MVHFPERSQGGHVVFYQDENEDQEGDEAAVADGSEDEYGQTNASPIATLVKVPVAGTRELRLEKMPKGLCDPRAMLALVDTVVTSCRRELCLGGRVVELGCGLGLPSLVCALFGAHVIASDLPQAIGSIKHNAACSGFPQDIWKVVAGKLAGGIVVQQSPAMGAAKEPEKLSFGALVEQVGQEGELIHYKKLDGNGPSSGWVRTRQPWGQTLLERTTEMPPTAGGQGSVRAISLPLENPDAARELLAGGNISLVLSSDCVNEPLYGEKSWQGLVDCIEILCGPNTIVLVSVQRRLHDGYDGFMSRLKQNLFVDELSSKVVGGSRILVFIIRYRKPREQFNSGLNDNFEAPRSSPPGCAIKVIRDLKNRSQGFADTISA